jgi:hypothetical protein
MPCMLRRRLLGRISIVLVLEQLIVMSDDSCGSDALAFNGENG